MNVASLQLVYHLESLGFVLSSSVIILHRFEFFVGFRCIWTLHCSKHKVALFQIWRLSRRAANFSLCIDPGRVKRLCALHPLEVFVWIAESELSLLHSLFELLSVFIHVIRQLMNHQSALILRLVHSFEPAKSEVGLFQVSRWLDRGAFAGELLWGFDMPRSLLAKVCCPLGQLARIIMKVVCTLITRSESVTASSHTIMLDLDIRLLEGIRWLYQILSLLFRPGSCGMRCHFQWCFFSIASQSEMARADILCIQSSFNLALFNISEMLWAKIIFRNRFVVYWISSEVVVGLSILLYSILLRLSPITWFCLWLRVSKPIVLLSCRAIICWSFKSHLKICDSHIWNLA